MQSASRYTITETWTHPQDFLLCGPKQYTNSSCRSWGYKHFNYSNDAKQQHAPRRPVYWGAPAERRGPVGSSSESYSEVPASDPHEVLYPLTPTGKFLDSTASFHIPSESLLDNHPSVSYFVNKP
jgi:hypothetical protein